MSGIIGAIGAVFGTAQKAEELVERHNDNVAGQNKIVAADSAASAQVNANVAKAAVDTTDAAVADKLRDGKF